MKRISAGEFKAKCLRLMDEVQETGEPYLITKRGRPVARLLPIGTAADDLFGYLKGTFEIAGDIDESPWRADSGHGDPILEKWERSGS